MRMRRSAMVKLTLVPMLASARLAHAQVIPDDEISAMAAAPPAQIWSGPPGMTAPMEPGLMPPGMSPIVPEGTGVELIPCTPGDDRYECRTQYVIHFMPHIGLVRGGFGHYFGGGGHG